VAELVGGDALADRLDHRLPRPVPHRRVERAGTGFDDAAGDQLTAARAAHRFGRGQRQPVAGDEAAQGVVKIERRVGQLCPPAKGEAMLRLFFRPRRRRGGELLVVGEDAAQVGRVVGGVALDQRCSLRHHHQVGIDLGGIETMPGYIVEGPRGHAAALVAFLSLHPQGPIDRRGNCKFVI